MHLYLDPVGGFAGDMFLGAVIDAWPDLAPGVQGILPALDVPEGVSIDVSAHGDGRMTGTRVHVAAPAEGPGRYGEIRRLLEASRLEGAVKGRAGAIFALLAEVESKVHGVPIEDVTFHEVGNWDSVVDITAAGYLIEALGGARWSIGSLPLGSGRVEGAHGVMPVPVPAAALLLEGFAVHRDGIMGERVTPTGAAILRHLEPAFAPTMPAARLMRGGVAFGSRALDGISNVLRIFAFETAHGAAGDISHAVSGDDVAVIQFEVDDQTPEDLAAGLERLRAFEGVLDVVQSTATGKKGRIVAQIQVLGRPEASQGVIDACFRETTSIGLRWHVAHRAVLARHTETVADADGDVRVKVVSRPGGVRTAKAEINDVVEAAGGHRARAGRRDWAQAAALERKRRNE